MTIEAPMSRYKKNNLKIYIAVCIGLGIMFGYDGYLSKYEWSYRYSFYKDNAPDGKPNGTLIFNQKVAPILVGAGIILAAYFWAIKGRKLVADDNAFYLSEDEAIKYDAIESIDKTNFAAKGYFVIAYKDERGRTVHKELSDRNWDHLAAVLDHLVAKIS
jgi:hypothetical protein